MIVKECMEFIERVHFALEWKRLTGRPLPLHYVSTR